MIEMHYSLEAAMRCLRQVLDDPRAQTIDATVEAYQNGREQGFLINPHHNYAMAVYVAQYRRSDDIVIYVGDFAMQSISENAYKNSTFFDAGAYAEAADCILASLQSLVTR